MQNTKILVEVPKAMKAKLDALRAEGTTASGLIRRLLNEYFDSKSPKTERRGGK